MLKMGSGHIDNEEIAFLNERFLSSIYQHVDATFEANSKNINEMLNLIDDFASSHHFPENFKNQLLTVGDELFSNIVLHGYKEQGGHIFVRLLFNNKNNEFIIVIIDKADEFNQLSVDNPKVERDIKKQHLGGLGILIVKKIMNEYTYERIAGKNVLILKKKF